MGKVIRLREQGVRIRAPRELVFQMLSHFGRGRIGGDSGESSRVLCRDGDRLVVEFKTRALFATYTTVEEVALYPPERIAFRHISGPLAYAREEFRLVDVGDGQTDLRYGGEFIWRRFPFFGWFGGVVYTRPVFERTMVRHLAEVKAAAEARAARSRVFPRG